MPTCSPSGVHNGGRNAVQQKDTRSRVSFVDAWDSTLMCEISFDHWRIKRLMSQFLTGPQGKISPNSQLRVVA